VIALNDAFYCCQQGVWFTATNPGGPWTVCTSIPAEVHTIPPSCPDYPVSYVYVYDSTPDYVYCGYLPGYTGCYIYGPTIVYGTGWWYPGWYHSVYYPHPWTWGFGAYYNPWTCDWGFGPSFGWGVSAGWFCLSFGWGHAGWWGPGGFHCDHFDIHGHRVVYHPAPFAPHSRFHFASVQTHVGHNNLYVRSENVARHPIVQTHVGPAEGRERARAVPNNVFADRDGRVLRRTNAGAWEEHTTDGWRPSTRVHSAEPSRPGGAVPGIPREREQPVPRAPERPAAPLPRAPERPVAPPRESFPTRPAVPPREDFERMNRAREQGAMRARGFSQRAGAGRGGRGPGRE